MATHLYDPLPLFVLVYSILYRIQLPQQCIIIDSLIDFVPLSSFPISDFAYFLGLCWLPGYLIHGET